MNILLLNGSPARPSHTRATLQYIADVCEQMQHSTEIINLVDAGLPINDPLHHADASKHPGESVRSLAQKVSDADVVVLGTPLYHGSYSGLLKSALDNLDGDAFSGKQIVLCGNSWGMRNAALAAKELIVVARTMSGRVNNRLIGTCNADFVEADTGHTLSSTDIQERIKQIVSGFVN